MPEYRVVWEIDVEADTPEEAAELARKAQEPGTLATVFLVRDRKTGGETQVDVG